LWQRRALFAFDYFSFAASANASVTVW